ncbi:MULTISPECIES: DMT family transporter [Bombella]|uniref:DMT family transporter n=2 Tax=Bombella TaxID=1654741 RepID=A0ABT3WJT1_9PROT|nr:MULTISPECIES: DMT family transporter [Bombella]MCT6837730.1 DMT family transporter [Bifidobacteriales bacterium]MCX5614714.1 DMT family transporter [Bombella saccharophila]MCX5618933.1 DMT family transporter [Bombella pollinis]MUG89542.1 EamA family transporter [Bombella sp. ESL0385]
MRKILFTSGIVLAFIGYAFFSISDACSKGLAGALDPFEVAFFGGVFGFLIVPTLRRPQESYSALVLSNHPWLWLLRAAAVFVATAASVEAFMLLPMPEALSLMFLMPFFVTIVSVLFLKEQVTGWAWLSVLLGFVGVMIVLRPGMKALNFGHLCAVLAAMSTAVSVIAYRFAGKEASRLTLFGSSLFGPLVGDGILMAKHFVIPHTVAEWLLLFGYGFLAAAGQLLLMLAASIAPANRVALPQYSQMAWIVAFSYFIFHQPVDVWDGIGILVVTFSGMLNWLRQKIRFEKMIHRGWWWKRKPSPEVIAATPAAVITPPLPETPHD